MPRPNTLSTIPEELLERILALCIDVPPFRTAPLLVCKRFLRIATPLFYHTLTLRSPRQTERLYHTLTSNPLLASFTRKLVVQSSDADHILRLCRDIEELDLLLLDGDVNEARIRRFCQALARIESIRCLTLRKAASTYLTHERPRLLLEGLADAVKSWKNLEYLTFAFRLSSTPSTDLLVGALAKSPRLHTVRAVMPTVLNSCFTTLSTNPVLRNIELIADDTPGGVIFGTGNGLFLKEARRHERLWACVRRGTPTLRARANTYSPPATAAAVSQIKPTLSMGSLAPPQGHLSPPQGHVNVNPNARRGPVSAGKGSRCPPPPPSAYAGYYCASGAGQYHNASGAPAPSYYHNTSTPAPSYYPNTSTPAPSNCYASSQVDSGYRSAARRGTR
ncbi:hypothetical protein NEOLEDRAFT_1132982 [Neolentinus lepideus HHB14362 ss-1]|uniref:F-box domain-containing protein n=1 Tax=Neolentinus lepideus HHB14362 ss-1 TaxID=1314782 RepID=A0A165T039_9AGAM|nr:hypothetical protein NEOLEDRAFT_1132982 [Neolentinus lepideus HHB14362 ss-1]